MSMKTETEINLTYEDLPTGNNEMMNSLKILQDTVKYYGKLVGELQITVERLETEIKKFTCKDSFVDERIGFSREEIKQIFRKE